METNPFTSDLLHKKDAYWRASNCLSVGKIYLYDHPLRKRPLNLGDVKHILLGHWGDDAWTELCRTGMEEGS